MTLTQAARALTIVRAALDTGTRICDELTTLLDTCGQKEAR